MSETLSTREQGDIGERAAVVWFLSQAGASVFLPFGHSPDADLVADVEGRLCRIQVKTSAARIKNGRFAVTLATRGGNQSWSGLVKRFSSDRCEYLFVLVADGRQWLIPAEAVEGGAGIVVGGPKYARWEIDRGRPIAEMQRMDR